MNKALEIATEIAASNPRAIQGIKNILSQDMGLLWREMIKNELDTVAKIYQASSNDESLASYLKNVEKK